MEIKLDALSDKIEASVGNWLTDKARKSGAAVGSWLADKARESR